eukprot:gnl/TRDRNA2_/TRDRNA2_193286_c0_seq1.p1 gnl/TRDRNA2_/TRDRNA2_193286_c0~~gnl/TRDRNA2_/TRDRNA2_193286_c0_seq1.p1  ORF type:complete len:351 (-),score=73.47 gnl/TRDRNA2_/TRDRNA2_193286_c0_seq1:89-1030(-)
MDDVVFVIPQDQDRDWRGIFADSLIDRAVQGSPSADLDDTMLGKTAHLAHTSLARSPSAALRKPGFLSPSRPMFTASVQPAARGPQVLFAEKDDVPEELRKSLKDPGMQERFANLQKAFASAEVQKKMKELSEDPQLKQTLDSLTNSGVANTMKNASMANLQKVVEKVATAMGPDVVVRSDQVDSLMDAVRLDEKFALEFTQKLLEAGKNPNEPDDDGNTPLLFAVTMGYASVVEALLAGGADASPADAKGNTPLHYAAATGRAPVIAALLDAGANPSIGNGKGKTPVDVVLQDINNPVANDKELMDRLRAAG